MGAPELGAAPYKGEGAVPLPEPPPLASAFLNPALGLCDPEAWTQITEP
jgi:hypothetical protein